ncbi:mitogen-activated protein kinase kinase kinase 9-like isoform X2 [Tamandua tetradactyla]|uniref:mitogen-activated protein kinase kinase kinase 9-like isoform X2 n=1 Tax=Tamandua tetradactyla TaxID=48850 RepID=UPI004053A9B9
MPPYSSGQQLRALVAGSGEPLLELRTWEEELTWAALQQKNLEELLQHKGQELAEWEIDILEWELNIILHQLCQEKPRLKKSMGKFRKSCLKLKDSNHISLPSGQWPGACWKQP